MYFVVDSTLSTSLGLIYSYIYYACTDRRRWEGGSLKLNYFYKLFYSSQLSILGLKMRFFYLKCLKQSEKNLKMFVCFVDFVQFT